MSYPALSTLLPQAGAMVLLDEVVACDEQRIVCRARSHQQAAHPLAHDGVLPAWAGVEYAAQAMAAHFAITGGGEGRIGLLGGLRDVACAVDRLDDVDGPLRIEASRLSADPSGSIYAFAVSAEHGAVELVRGRATVVHPVESAS